MKRIFFILTIMFLCSCGRNRDHHRNLQPESGVALIQCVNYYSIEFSQGFTAYFSSVNQDGSINGFAFEKDEVEPAYSYGTGFFVNSKGVLATNYHVVHPIIDEDAVRNTIVQSLIAFAESLQKEVDETNMVVGAAQYALNSGETLDNSSREKIISMIEKKENNEQFIQSVKQLSYSEYKIRSYSSVSLALSETRITNSTQFVACDIIAEDKNNDLALIQETSCSTPKECYVFEVSKGGETNDRGARRRGRDNKSSSSKIVGKELTMIGYNMGPSLALTTSGIKPQVTKGNISQDTDVTSIMYTIPALPGSSGSPVVDSDGNLYAINHAGISTTQGFNFGIKAMHLYNLMNTSNMME